MVIALVSSKFKYDKTPLGLSPMAHVLVVVLTGQSVGVTGSAAVTTSQEVVLMAVVGIVLLQEISSRAQRLVGHFGRRVDAWALDLLKRATAKEPQVGPPKTPVAVTVAGVFRM